MGVAREKTLLRALLDGRRNVGDVAGSFTVLHAVHPTAERFAIVPSSDDIGEVEARFAKMRGGTELLIDRLRSLGRECHIVIDTAPGITSFLGRAAIVAADIVIIPVFPEPGADRRVIEVVNLLRGMGGGGEVFVVAAQANGNGSDVDVLNDGLRDDHLTVCEWFLPEPSIAHSTSSIGTPLLLAPASQCAASYRSLARKVHAELVEQRSLALLQHSRLPV
jgi:cellulose biosynthesis protein BcsQ